MKKGVTLMPCLTNYKYLINACHLYGYMPSNVFSADKVVWPEGTNTGFI